MEASGKRDEMISMKNKSRSSRSFFFATVTESLDDEGNGFNEKLHRNTFWGKKKPVYTYYRFDTIRVVRKDRPL